MRCIFLIVLLSLFSMVIFAQIPTRIDDEKIAALYEKLDGTDGKDRVDLLNDLSLHLAPVYLDSCHKYARQALELARELEYEKGVGVAFFNLGNGFIFRMDIENAYPHYLKAQRTLETLEPSEELANLYLQFALINYHVFAWGYAITRDQSRSSRYLLQKALEIFRASGNKESEIYTLRRLAYNEENSDSLIYQLHQLEPYYASLNDPYYQYLSDMELAHFYFHLNRDPKCLEYGLKALESAKNTGDGLYVATALHKIVNYYENYDNQPQLKTDWELASKYLLEAKHILDTTPPRAYHHYLLAEGYRELAELAGDLGRWEQAPEFAEAGLKSTDMFFQTFDSSQFDNLPERMMYYGHAHTNQGFLYGAFMGYYSVMGDIEKAGEFNEKSTEALHRYDKKQLSLKITLLQKEYENELLARDARLLETDIERKSLQLSRTRLILILIGGSSLFIILFLYWYFQRIRLKSSLKILETEHALLRSQMNPHFLFNMITSIQNFIVKEQPQKASLFLSRFSKLVRNILDHSSEEFIPLEKEIETLEHYLELQKNRYGDLFEYTISIDEQLDEFNTRIPAMMLQPFIENAIDHGIKPKKSKGRIGIRFIQKGQETWVEVEDNGVGREKAAELKNGQIHNKHLSRATFLIQQRIDVLNRKYHIKIYFEIIDLTDDVGKATGTLVRIILPEKY